MVVEFQGPAGRLEGLLDLPAAHPNAPRAVVVFAHPHPLLGGGGSMHTKAVYQGAKGLVRAGCAVLRFNFRGVGRSEGTFDNGVGERGDFRAALDFAESHFATLRTPDPEPRTPDSEPRTPLWSAGFSFGSWIALEVGAEDPRVSKLIGIAPPWTREGYTWEHVLTSTKPKVFVQGEGDEICSIQDMWLYYGKLEEPKELVVIDAANHLFDGRASEVGDALEELVSE